THAVKKVSHVVFAHLQPDRVVRQRREEQLLVAGGDFIAVDPDPPVCAGELYSVALAVLVDDHAERVVVGRGFDDLLHAIGPGERGFKFAGCGVTVGQWRGDDPGFDPDRALQANGPARDVV